MAGWNNCFKRAKCRFFAADVSMELTPFPPHLFQRLPKQRWLNVLCDTQDWLMTMLSGLPKVLFVPIPCFP